MRSSDQVKNLTIIQALHKCSVLLLLFINYLLLLLQAYAHYYKFINFERKVIDAKQLTTNNN